MGPPENGEPGVEAAKLRVERIGIRQLEAHDVFGVSLRARNAHRLFRRVGGDDFRRAARDALGPITCSASHLEHSRAAKPLGNLLFQKCKIGLAFGLGINRLVLARAAAAIVDQPCTRLAGALLTGGQAPFLAVPLAPQSPPRRARTARAPPRANASPPR